MAPFRTYWSAPLHSTISYLSIPLLSKLDYLPLHDQSSHQLWALFVLQTHLNFCYFVSWDQLLLHHLVSVDCFTQPSAALKLPISPKTSTPSIFPSPLLFWFSPFRLQLLHLLHFLQNLPRSPHRYSHQLLIILCSSMLIPLSKEAWQFSLDLNSTLYTRYFTLLFPSFFAGQVDFYQRVCFHFRLFLA